jgi:hypothetical protein
MYIIAIAWIYVVSMMAMTEPSVTAALITFTSYCVIPLGIVWFIANNIKRRFVKPQNGQEPLKKTNAEQ